MAGLAGTSSVATPKVVNVKYRKDEGDILDDPTLYRRLVGSLIYCPDISDAVHQSEASSAIFVVLLLVCYSFLLAHLFDLLHTVMLFGLCALIPVALLLAGIRGILEELEFPLTTSTPLHIDNTSAIQIATNPFFH
ncbi:uncharacterized protein [Aristolochia californica]|uniref:uncharacterized protein n=1 Tax=Aristolochia californica TaxID=171875 RepID=UPI0035DE3127